MKKFILFGLLIISAEAFAGARESAYKLHNRLAGIPPKPEVLDEMSDLISRGNAEAAAQLAMSNPTFYNITLKNWIKPWSTRDQTSRIELNDYTATIIGVIRDEIPFDQILYGDILYNVDGTGAGIANYSNVKNDHYRDAENKNINLMQKLVKQTQSDLVALPATAVAGVTTTKTSADNYFSGGTNRRVNRYIFINFLCRDYEDLHDITVPDFRVARDIERNPGGDSRTYKNRCVGCHAGQDALRGAYAYYNSVDGKVIYDTKQVQGKMNQNNSFSQGFVTVDEKWMNLWASGQNASLGWRGETSGTGAKSLGKMFAKSRAFSQCMAKKVFKLVCMKEPIQSADLAAVEINANSFEAGNAYNMKKLIAKTSAGCVSNE